MRFLLVVGLVGCVGNQSARVLSPGSVAVSGGLLRMTSTEDGDDDTIWLGEMMARYGVGDRFDAGLRIGRTAGRGESVSLAQVDGKFEITSPGAQTAISASFGVGLAWAEEGTETGEGTIVASPAILLGHMVSPTTELVLSPHLSVIKPNDTESLFGIGVSLGARIGERTYGIYPALDITRLTDSDGGSMDSVTLIIFGLGISVGN